MSVTAVDITLGHDLLAIKWYFTGACALLAYDYCLTFADEIDYMWGGKKTLMFYLFLLNRYNSFAWCFITLFAYFSPLWTVPICNRFAIVEWIQALTIALAAEAVLMLRVYALTNRRRSFLYFLILMASTQSILVVYAISRVRENKALPLPDIPIDAFHICILFSDPVKDMSYLAVSITFDGIVLCLTLAVTVSTSKNRPTMPLLRTIRRDGLIYFFVIFSGNLAWMLLALYARAGLKFMNAQSVSIRNSALNPVL